MDANLPELLSTNETPKSTRWLHVACQFRFIFFSTSDLLYRKTKSTEQQVRDWALFYMITQNLNISFGIVDCLPYNRHFALKDDYYENSMDKIAYIPHEFNYVENLGKNFVHAIGQNQFFQEKILNNAPVGQIAPAMHTNWVFTRSHAEIPFW